MVISGAKFLSLYDGDLNLAKRRIWTCIRTTGKLPPKKPVQKKARKTTKESSGPTDKNAQGHFLVGFRVFAEQDLKAKFR